MMDPALETGPEGGFGGAQALRERGGGEGGGAAGHFTQGGAAGDFCFHSLVDG